MMMIVIGLAVFFFGKYDNDDNENKRQKQNEWIVTHAYFIMDFYWQ